MAGKGDKWRKTDFKKYSDAEYWKELEKRKKGEKKMNETIKTELENAGYNYAVAVATNAEIEAGAACGQLSLLDENTKE